jgi:hypothetical protein
MAFPLTVAAHEGNDAQYARRWRKEVESHHKSFLQEMRMSSLTGQAVASRRRDASLRLRRSLAGGAGRRFDDAGDRAGLGDVDQVVGFDLGYLCS